MKVVRIYFAFLWSCRAELGLSLPILPDTPSPTAYSSQYYHTVSHFSLGSCVCWLWPIKTLNAWGFHKSAIPGAEVFFAWVSSSVSSTKSPIYWRVTGTLRVGPDVGLRWITVSSPWQGRIEFAAAFGILDDDRVLSTTRARGRKCVAKRREMTHWDESGVVGHDSYRPYTSYVYYFVLVNVCPRMESKRR